MKVSFQLNCLVHLLAIEHKMHNGPATKHRKSFHFRISLLELVIRKPSISELRIILKHCNQGRSKLIKFMNLQKLKICIYITEDD